MTEQTYKDNNQTQAKAAKWSDDELDAAGRSLSEALSISFAILKIIIIVLIIVFLASGFRTVGPDEQALVLRFGKIRGVGEQRLLGPGLHWVLPYPIDEIVKVPVAKKINLPIDSFWYFERQSDLIAPGPKGTTRVPAVLNPIYDGYCITRGEREGPRAVGSAGSDYGIVHCKWQLTYSIDEPERFFKNAYVAEVKPGQSYADVIATNVKPMLENLVADSVVTAMVNYTIDEAISSQDRIPKHVKRLLQGKLDQIEAGINVVSVQLIDITWPRQVNRAFSASIRASQESQKTISQAKGYAENTLNEAGGPVALKLLEAFNDRAAPEGTEQRELLWSQLAGQAQEKIANSRAYRTKVVENAKANAEYLRQILPEYRKHPKLVIQKIYQDAIENILENAEEKIIIQPAEGAKDKEIRILLNRNPAIKGKK